MTLTIDISPALQNRLHDQAARLGIDESEYVKQVLERDLVVLDQATLDLLAQWDAEDLTQDPQELALRQAEWERFRNAMNQNSLSGRPIYP